VFDGIGKVMIFLRTGKDAAALPLIGTLRVGCEARDCKRSRRIFMLPAIYDVSNYRFSTTKIGTAFVAKTY
jgi:hypothetical protein